MILKIPILLLFIVWPLIPAISADTQLSDQESVFLQQHWPPSILPQGTPPASYSKLESSLQPKSCGNCHIEQYRDWQTSMHSKAMGPGLLGQLVNMVDEDPGTAQACWRCHTPLAEQQDKLFINGSWQTNPAFNPQLQSQGLICAGCHVRKHQRFGPPAKQKNNVSGTPPHNGFTTETAFSKSAFCKGCHQFNSGDYALNGKLIENTYNEWLASDYPAKGIQCQTCHMPDRQHLWRGIHDANMVKQGVTIQVTTRQAQHQIGDLLEASTHITNSAVGHYFPTYLTPRIEVLAYLLDADNAIITSTVQQAYIGRAVSLDMQQEHYDTRIPPHETLTIEYQQKVTANRLKLHIKMTVFPDHFYTQFYEAMLNSDIAKRGDSLIKQALLDSQASSFTLFETTLPLNKQQAVKTRQPAPLPTSAKFATTPPEAKQHALVASKTPDWNAEQIQWFNYDEGVKYAEQYNKAIMLIFYADWCPTCHAYNTIFADPRIVEQAKTLVMVRINIDNEKPLADQYVNDGNYVPRIYTLSSHGNPITSWFKQRSYPQHFVSADDTNKFLSMMQSL